MQEVNSYDQNGIKPSQNLSYQDIRKAFMMAAGEFKPLHCSLQSGSKLIYNK